MNIINLLIIISALFVPKQSHAKPPVAYDIERAKEICSEYPLDNLEGVWLYPDDRVTVLILQNNKEKASGMPQYDIQVIDGEDCRIKPGDCIGTLTATPSANVYKIELFTEEKNHLLCKPESCLATLSKEGESLIIKKEKNPFRLRLNFNFNRLLSGFWKIVSIGINKNNNTSLDPPVGMIKIYPSFDGNGSSKKGPRYL